MKIKRSAKNKLLDLTKLYNVDIAEMSLLSRYGLQGIPNVPGFGEKVTIVDCKDDYRNMML